MIFLTDSLAFRLLKMLRRVFPLARCVSRRTVFGPPNPRFVVEELGRRFNELERELSSGRKLFLLISNVYIDSF